MIQIVGFRQQDKAVGVGMKVSHTSDPRFSYKKMDGMPSTRVCGISLRGLSGKGLGYGFEA